MFQSHYFHYYLGIQVTLLLFALGCHFTHTTSTEKSGSQFSAKVLYKFYAITSFLLLQLKHMIKTLKIIIYLHIQETSVLEENSNDNKNINLDHIFKSCFTHNKKMKYIYKMNNHV